MKFYYLVCPDPYELPKIIYRVIPVTAFQAFDIEGKLRDGFFEKSKQAYTVKDKLNERSL